MFKQIFVNLPVKNLKNSIHFFTQLGFTFDPKFTNENATCMIVGENIYVMLLVETFFQSFTDKTICDASKSVEALVALATKSRKEVDEIVSKAVGAGGKTPRKAYDHGFMYGHAFEDLDGHTWEFFYMEPSK